MSPAITNDIEQIVRMVVHRLRAQGLDVIGGREQFATVDGGAVNESGQNATDGVLRLNSNVISLSEIQDRLSGVHTVQIGAKALVTPAVKDELRRHKIRIASVGVRPSPTQHFAADEIEATSQTAGNFQVIADSDKLKTIVAIVKAVPLSSRLTDRPAVDLVQRILQDWRKDSRAVWCSLEPYSAAVACMTSGEHRLRAVGLHHPAELKQALYECDPNILVVDDRRWSGHQVARLIQSWSRLDERFSGKAK